MNECEITRDLIPGYADEVLSPSGREYVEAHTADCPECMDILEKAKATVVTGNVAENVKAKKPFKKVNFKKIIIISASALLAVMIVFFGVFAINDANNGWYKLNRLFFHNPTEEMFDVAMRLNSDEVFDVTGYNYEEFKKYTVLKSRSMSSGDKGIAEVMVSTYLSSKDEIPYMIYVEGYPTGIGTYRIEEFVITGKNENDSLAIISDDGQLFCAAMIEKHGHYIDCAANFDYYRNLVIKEGDKEEFIANQIKMYSEYWSLEQAEEMSESDWERHVVFIENERKDRLKSLREEYKIPEEVIEKWMSYAE